MHTSILRLFRGLLALGLAVSSLGLQAAPPVQKTQVPGYYRHTIGSFEVTALYDGYVDLGTPLLKGLRADQIQSLLARMFIDSSKGVQTAVNAYLVHTGEHLVLVDAGAASCFGPSLGQVLDNIRAAGYQPEQVDTVLLTHLHPDHLCGVLDKAGQAAFPKATLWAAQQDIDFWLDEKTANAAPKDNQPFFRMAMDAVRPYQSAGRLRSFTAGDTLLPGVSVVGTPGHTPGHSSYLFSSGEQKLLVWGDIVHSHAVRSSGTRRCRWSST